ncbi:acyl-CoA dehydrogenase family protein [Ramlibacter sp.]|uniref:acyl-CoA dehydrogenase family protein n=1 Tax=Ramlibacter sp. TaxID=1917967 RepID=UPI003D0AA7ED
MNFDLSDEQRMLGEAVAGFLEKRSIPQGDARAQWRQLCELGLVALPFDAEHGGIEGGPVEHMIVLQALGGALALDPYLSCAVMAGSALHRLADETLKRELLPRFASGDAIVAWSHEDSGALRASRTANGWTLHGERPLVLGGGLADRVLVSAAVDGGDGWGVFLVDPAQAGVVRKAYRMPDGHDAADLKFDNVQAQHAVGTPGQMRPHIDWVQSRGLAALSAEAVGAMSACLRTTVDYLNVRQQFGVPLSTMQSLQHKVADMQVELELSRSMMMLAAASCDMDDAAQRNKTLSAAKARIGRAARHVGQEAVQLHGGMGMTEDCKAGHYLRRLVVIDILFGDADEHLQRLADAGGLIEPAPF